MFDFTGQVVVVSGAVGNLGQAVARAFLSCGARLVLPDRKPGRLAQRFPELVDSNEHILAETVDLTDETAVQAMTDQAVRRFGRVDVLANIAGGFQPGKPVHETSLAEWDGLYNQNLRTALVLSRAVIPAMLARGQGKIINVSSSAALKGKARMAAYSAAKSALLRLTESMSAELKSAGINVNCILPGTIDTPENRRDMPNADTTRWVAPEALADVVLFLASPAARAVHGAALPVYGLSGE